MRFFFLIIFLAGLALGIAYPWAVRNISGYEIGTFQVFDRGSGFSTADVSLAPSEAPVRVDLQLHTSAPFTSVENVAAFTVTATTDGRTIFVAPVSFANAEARTASPQRGMIYRADVAVIDPVNGDDDYVFTVDPGEIQDIPLERAELIVNAGAFDLDPRAVPIGYILILVGIVGFVAMLRRRREINRRKEVEEPRWGRGPDKKE